MSKYNSLWEYIQKTGKPQLTLCFDEIEKIAGVPIDHSFLKYKKELNGYGYEVEKISMKARTVLFCGGYGGYKILANTTVLVAFFPCTAKNSL